ncbi:hypothetical protein BAE44_0017372 [Dichanthelium oligosanthes]|uniref:Uncharacterized protein n=1 Tax=Dichanthelium oligosanthes TaxID=888268 RepID=A0A1E5V8X6_9POAL|nr:hypothetical protein BAE44_0017372 [Dichanthelium oligosanthes]
MQTPMAPSPHPPPPRSPPREPHPDLHDLRVSILENLCRRPWPHEALGSPTVFGAGLDRHLSRLPLRYSLDHHMAEDNILLHWRILDECADDPDKRPVFHGRYLKVVILSSLRSIVSDDDLTKMTVVLVFTSVLMIEQCVTVHEDYDDDDDAIGSNQELDELHRRGERKLFLHEIIFSSVDRPMLLTGQASELLSEVGLNIREAHVYTTTDGFCLGIFVVDGWETEVNFNGAYYIVSDRIILYYGGYLVQTRVFQKVLTQ